MGNQKSTETYKSIEYEETINRNLLSNQIIKERTDFFKMIKNEIEKDEIELKLKIKQKMIDKGMDISMLSDEFFFTANIILLNVLLTVHESRERYNEYIYLLKIKNNYLQNENDKLKNENINLTAKIVELSEEIKILINNNNDYIIEDNNHNIFI